MLVMLDIIAESEDQLYKAKITKEKKQREKDVRHSPNHIHNKPHALIVASHHPPVAVESEQK